MAFVLCRALRLDLPPRVANCWALGLTPVIGFGDETIQWVLPQRFFELKDIQLNAVSGALGLLLAHFGQVARGQEENNEVTHRPITPAAVDERTGQGASRPAANPAGER